MGFIGNKPSAVPLTGSDLADGIINSAKIADGTIVSADINASAAIALTKLASNPTTTVYVGTLTRDMEAATGTVATTGVGFVPKALIFFAVDVNSTAYSWGFDDGTNSLTLYSYHYAVADTVTHSDTFSIYMRKSASLSQGAVVNSFDSDGFTLSWTRTGTTTAGTGIIKYLAIG